MNNIEKVSEWENWKDAWGPIGVWFGDINRGFKIIFLLTILFSFVDWLSVYQLIYGEFLYESIPYFSKLENIQKYNYLYEKNAVAFSAVIAPIFMYFLYPVFFAMAVYIAIKRNLKNPEITYTRNKKIGMFVWFFASLTLIYFALPRGFPGPSEFFGQNEFLKNNFWIYIFLFMGISYTGGLALGFWTTWFLVHGIKRYFFKI